MSRDPIGLEGGVNVYAYCAGNPVMSADPSGLQQAILLMPPVAPGMPPVYVVPGGVAGPSLLARGGLYGIAFGIGWGIGTALDQHLGLSRTIGPMLGGAYEAMDRMNAEPDQAFVLRIFLASGAEQQAQYLEIYSFLAPYVNLRPGALSTEWHHELPKKHKDHWKRVGLAWDTVEYMVPLTREYHKIVHGKRTDTVIFVKGYNKVWDEFFSE